MQSIKLTDNQLKEINGGAITSTLINAIVKGFSLIIEIGKSLGSSIRRATSGKFCST